MQFVIVPKEVNKAMLEAARGIYWSSETEAEKVQLLWNRMIAASGDVVLADKNAVFNLGKRSGIEEVQESIKNALNIKECFCDNRT